MFEREVTIMKEFDHVSERFEHLAWRCYFRSRLKRSGFIFFNIGLALMAAGLSDHLVRGSMSGILLWRWRGEAGCCQLGETGDQTWAG